MGKYEVRQGFLVYRGHDSEEVLDEGRVKLISLLSLCILRREALRTVK